MVSGQQGRNPSLDFLRCIAIILVMFRHLYITGDGFFAQCAHVLAVGGWMGVDLFFVLSGFLVSGLIFNEYEKSGSFNAWRFFIRRGFKIYPVFYFFLALFWGLYVYKHLDDAVRGRRFLYEALFICNYTELRPEHGWVWTLCVEEHFYLLLCILMVVLIRIKRVNLRTFWLLYIVFLVIGLATRAWAVFEDAHANLYVSPSHRRFDALFFGVLLAFLYRYTNALKKPSTALTALSFIGILLPVTVTLFVGNDEGFPPVIFLSTTAVCFGYLMIRILNVRASWMRPFAYVGRYSYSIYLFHGVVNFSARARFTGWKYNLAYFLGSLVVGIIISKLVEYPFLAIRDRFFPSLSGRRRFAGIGNSA
jgi:peptidoglycan/LPS O-acetylase OafA/YrhL